MTQCHVHHMAVTIPQWTSHQEIPALIQRLFGLDGIDPDTIIQKKGRHGYPTLYSLKTDTCAELIGISTASRSESNNSNTTHVIVHGDALEAGNLDPRHIASEILSMGGWCSEIHLAADDHGGVLDFNDIITATDVDAAGGGEWESRVTTTACRPHYDKSIGQRIPTPPRFWKQFGRTVEFPGKSLQIVIYDRRGYVRVETRLKSIAAASDVMQRIAAGDNLHSLTLGTLAANLTIHVPGARRKDRKPPIDYWTAFIAGTEPLKLNRDRATANKSPWYKPKSKGVLLEQRTATIVDAPTATEQDYQDMLSVLKRNIKTIEDRIRDLELDRQLEEADFGNTGIFHPLQQSGLVNRIDSPRIGFAPFDMANFCPEIQFG